MARPSLRHPVRPRPAGVSLVEALVALAVMAFGMLALVGVQSTMRLNSDLAKQRTEATRIATEEVERLRVFIAMGAVGGQANLSWDEIAPRVLPAYVPPDAIGNTTYSVVRTVNRVPAAAANVTAPSQQKVVRVQVQWTDRAGTVQTVTVDSLIAGVAPALSGLLNVPAQPSAANQAGGRQASIPREAVDLGDGGSAFKPFNTGTVVWVFDNTTGFITSRCSGVVVAQSAIVRADLSTCSVVDGRRLAGVVQFDLGSNPSSESPAGRSSLPLHPTTPVAFVTSTYSPVNQATPAVCVANSPGSRSAAAVRTPLGFAVAYECVVFPADATGWGGRLNVVLTDHYANGDDLPSNAAPTDFKVCRYTADLPSADDSDAAFTTNADHPRSYCVEKPGTITVAAPCTGKKVTGNLANQNFLVIAASESCPADNVSTVLVNGNTRPHQP